MRTIRGLWICAVLASWTADSATAVADTVTLTPVKDNSIFSSDDAASNGLGGLFSGMTGEATVLRCLLAFDIAAQIPAGSTITGASLTLTVVAAAPNSGAQTHALHRVQQDWGEGTSFAFGGGGAPATPGDVTWLYRFFPDAALVWNTLGGDFEPVASATQVLPEDTGPFTWGPTPQMVADVQGWLDQPDSSFGWILLGNETMLASARKFASREFELPDQRPALTIEYTPPAPQGALDIKPGTCPNSFNPRSQGKLPVALLGTPDFNVSQVDVASLALQRADGVGGSVGPLFGPPGPHPDIEDVATPIEGASCACHDLGSDQLDDLVLKFSRPELVDALQLNTLPAGSEVELLLSGTFQDGSAFTATDCIRLEK